MQKFILRRRKNEHQFIDPAISTKAIEELTEYLDNRFSGRSYCVDDKPTAAVCFDTSGSGKTTTVREACRRNGADRMIISPNLSVMFALALSRCSELRTSLATGPMVNRDMVVMEFSKKFYSVLDNMFQEMSEFLLAHENSNDPITQVAGTDTGTYDSPDSSATNLRRVCGDSFQSLRKTLGKNRKLVIHVDDCQLFYKGLVTSDGYFGSKEIPVNEIMTLALSCFSQCITPFAGFKNIVWIFSGTRPNLCDDITLTSGLKIQCDFSDLMTDFSAVDVEIILKKYFDLSKLSAEESIKLNMLCSSLVGPPKNVNFFLRAADKHEMTCPQDLFLKWDKIESGAIHLFRGEISASLKGDLDGVARNLCLLHTTALILSNQNYFDVPSISHHFIHLIEAGLLRVHKNEKSGNWRVFSPNRFLVSIFHKYVRWYTWERIEMLKNLIISSAVTLPLKGKVFEFLFALELCNSADSNIWNLFGSVIGILPLGSWNPQIVTVNNIDQCSNISMIYVMIDPDRSNTKTDVIFFARHVESGEIVRVLTQLTLSKNSQQTKINSSFNSMLSKVKSKTIDGNQLRDFRLFIGPNCSGTLSPHHMDNRCFVFLHDSDILESFQLSIPIICNSQETENAIKYLVEQVEQKGELTLANRIMNQIENLSIRESTKRRRFSDDDTIHIHSYVNVKYDEDESRINMKDVNDIRDLHREIKAEYGDDIKAPAARIFVCGTDGNRVEYLKDIPNEYFRESKDGGLFLEIHIAPLKSNGGADVSAQRFDLINEPGT